MVTTYHYGKFPPKNLAKDKSLQQLINKARENLVRYDGLLLAISNPKVLLTPLLKQESVLSSKIEGTQSSLSDVLEFEADENKKINLDKKNDILEVINYRLAIEKATKLLNTYPLSNKVLLKTHKVLMQGVRGKNKSPGIYRKVPNWIGSDNNKENARFIPIDANKIGNAMSEWEKYIHDDNSLDDFLKVAILHAEFEAIHPFLDGNGRLGRIFIPLYLWQKKILSSPSFYISAYFEKNRQKYYDLLLNISRKNDWASWCKFFLQAIIKQSQDNQNKVKKIMLLFKELRIRIPEITKSQYGITALDYIFNKPYFNSKQFYNEVKIPKPTAQRLLKVFCNSEILLLGKKGVGRTPNFYLFSKLLNIVEGRDIF